jgi:subfamily B ATP-binding cassette protein HlyB/CyaB
MEVLDPGTGQTYSWGWSELMKKAYTGTATYDMVSSSKLLRQVIREELTEYGMDPEQLQGQDEAEVVNKLTYFSYLKDNFGFADREVEKKFLEDLLLYHQLSMLPKQFRALKFSRDKLKIAAPVVLTVKPTEALMQTRLSRPAPVKPLNGYLRLVREMKHYHKLWFFLPSAWGFSGYSTSCCPYIKTISPFTWQISSTAIFLHRL